MGQAANPLLRGMVQSRIASRNFVHSSLLKSKMTAVTRTQVSRTVNRGLSLKFEHPMVFYDFTNINNLFEGALKAYPRNPAFGTYDRHLARYDWMTFEDFGEDVSRLRRVLKNHNVGFDDKVGIIANNRVEWAMTKYATVGVGAQIVPM